MSSIPGLVMVPIHYSGLPREPPETFLDLIMFFRSAIVEQTGELRETAFWRSDHYVSIDTLQLLAESINNGDFDHVPNVEINPAEPLLKAAEIYNDLHAKFLTQQTSLVASLARLCSTLPVESDLHRVLDTTLSTWFHAMQRLVYDLMSCLMQGSGSDEPDYPDELRVAMLRLTQTAPVLQRIQQFKYRDNIELMEVCCDWLKSKVAQCDKFLRLCEEEQQSANTSNDGT